MARGLTAGWGYQPHLLAHFPVPDLIKMDIEGAETRAFAGASRLLSERRTAIFLALHDHALEEAPAILRRHNFLLQQVAERETWATPDAAPASRPLNELIFFSGELRAFAGPHASQVGSRTCYRFHLDRFCLHPLRG